jgi:hypothetical protein
MVRLKLKQLIAPGPAIYLAVRLGLDMRNTGTTPHVALRLNDNLGIAAITKGSYPPQALSTISR